MSEVVPIMANDMDIVGPIGGLLILLASVVYLKGMCYESMLSWLIVCCIGFNLWGLIPKSLVFPWYELFLWVWATCDNVEYSKDDL